MITPGARRRRVRLAAHRTLLERRAKAAEKAASLALDAVRTDAVVTRQWIDQGSDVPDETYREARQVRHNAIQHLARTQVDLMAAIDQLGDL